MEVLLDALPTILKRYPKAQVLFAGTYQNVMGEQAYYDRLMPRIREYEIVGHWTFLGNLDPIEMAAFYPNLDALTVPSLNSTEAFGLVQIEAHAERSTVSRPLPRRAAGVRCTAWDAPPKLATRPI